jgi:hypothetical protein
MDRPVTPATPTIEVRVVRKDLQQVLESSPLPPASLVPSTKEFEALEAELINTKATLTEKESEISQVKVQLQVSQEFIFIYIFKFRYVKELLANMYLYFVFTGTFQ